MTPPQLPHYQTLTPTKASSFSPSTKVLFNSPMSPSLMDAFHPHGISQHFHVDTQAPSQFSYDSGHGSYDVGKFLDATEDESDIDIV